jgi:hypothetical protein
MAFVVQENRDDGTQRLPPRHKMVAHAKSGGNIPTLRRPGLSVRLILESRMAC